MEYLSILLFYKLIRFVKLAIESNILEYLSITIIRLIVSINFCERIKFFLNYYNGKKI